MTREQKLWSMTMKMLIAEAEKINVKVDKKGSRAKAIEKILAAEAKMAEVAEVETAEEEKCSDGTEYAEVMQEIMAGAEKKAEEAKAEKKAKASKKRKSTFEELVANIPVCAGMRLVKSSRGDVYVKMGTDPEVRVFWYYKQWVIVGDEALAEGLEAEKKPYGYRMAPTRENMLAVLANYRKEVGA